MLRSLLTAVVAAAAVTLSGMSADAGLFFNRGGNCGNDCGACAAPAPVCGGCETSCRRPKRVKCKRVRNNCCNTAPSCCAPVAAPSCCAPVAPVCAAPAPTCCAPVAAPTCCAPAPSCAAPAMAAPAAAPAEALRAAPKPPVEEAPKPQ